MIPFLALGGFDASAIGDPDGTRTVIAIVALLVVLGLALIMLAFWLRRSTRPDPEFLAPLEAMGERSWRNRDAVWQRRRLDEVRPADAKPLKRPTAPPALDESFDAGPSARGFDDLHDDQRGVDSADVAERGAPADPTRPLHGTDPDADLATFPQPADDSSREPIDDDAVDDGDADGDVADGATDGDPTPTPIYSERPLDDFSDREIDPDELAKAMAELDEELQRRSPDQ